VSKIREYLFLFLTAGFVVALDQYSKWLVRSQLAFGEMWMPAPLEGLLPYVRIVYWHNSGAAFGLFQRGNLILSILAFIVIGVIIYYYPRVSPDDWWLKLAMGLQLGGATGNLIDRLTQGQVTDFISVSTFPVWNVADSAITIGTFILLLGVYLKERHSGNQTKDRSESLKPGSEPASNPETGEPQGE
jgi:signal peptidase II